MKAKLLSVTATVLMVAMIFAALPLTIPKLFGYNIYNVLTSSMEPELPTGSMIYVKKCDPKALQKGDVITFRLNQATGLVETHRVMENDLNTQQITTKGDANEQPDVTPVRYDRVVGKVVFKIPLLGIVSEKIQSPVGIGVCVGTFALAILMWTLADKMKKRERFE